MDRRFLFLVGAGAALLAGMLAAQEPNTASDLSRAVLVLRNGEVLQGRISRTEDRFRVDLDAGTLFVSATEVELCCGTLEEAYELKASQVGFGQAHDHARLAQWCQHHGLNQQAEKELDTARRLDPKHPLIDLVERRLAAARAERRITASADDSQSNPEPSPLQLDEFAAGLPQGTVESFTRVIQPILLNRCATSGCHTTRSENAFRLERPPMGAPINQRSTQRNLFAALQLIDRAAPERSELISPKRCPHRIDTDATLSLARSGQYRYLVAWVYALAGNPASANTPAPAASIAAARPTAAVEAASFLAAPPPATPSSTAPTGAATAAKPTTNPFAPPAPTTSASPSTAIQPAPVAADPFDPEVFNRRFGTRPAEPVPPPVAAQ